MVKTAREPSAEAEGSRAMMSAPVRSGEEVDAVIGGDCAQHNIVAGPYGHHQARVHGFDVGAVDIGGEDAAAYEVEEDARAVGAYRGPEVGAFAEGVEGGGDAVNGHLKVAVVDGGEGCGLGGSGFLAGGGSRQTCCQHFAVGNSCDSVALESEAGVHVAGGGYDDIGAAGAHVNILEADAAHVVFADLSAAEDYVVAVGADGEFVGAHDVGDNGGLASPEGDALYAARRGGDHEFSVGADDAAVTGDAVQQLRPGGVHHLCRRRQGAERYDC